MGRDRKARSAVGVDGPWFGVPVAFFASTACAELSPLGCKMLLTLVGQLRSNHFGNGRIDAHERTLRRYGWTSAASARAALHELLAAGLLVCTRAGRKGTVGLYGITLFCMHCEPGGLEVGPGAWSVTDWRERKGSDAPPTDERPARWRRPRGTEKRKASPRSGNESPVCTPVAGTIEAQKAPCAPATGTHTSLQSANAVPLRESPLREAICSQPQHAAGNRMGRLLHRARPTVSQRPAGYLAARPSFATT